MSELLGQLAVPALGVLINLMAKLLAVERTELKYEDLAVGIDLAATAAVAVPAIAIAVGDKGDQDSTFIFLIALAFLLGATLYDKFVGKMQRGEKKFATHGFELMTFFLGVFLPAAIGGTALAVVLTFQAGRVN
jgi:hypothetical protein